MLHITVSVFGLAILALAFIAAALYLLQFHELKAKRFGPVFRLFPPLERLRSEEHTSELQSQSNLVCRLLLEKKKKHKSKSRTQPDDHAHTATQPPLIHPAQ